jgi:GTPase SAR1 family protein
MAVKDLFQRLQEQQEVESKEGLSIDEPNQESEVIFVGAKSSGKSSLILGFVNKADPPKPTAALEYRYATSASEGSKVIIANIWELAGDTQLAQLLDIVLTPPKLARSQIVIVADLSKPSEVLRTVNYWLDAVRERVDACARELRKSDAGQTALKQLEARLQPSSAEVRPVGIPTIIVGSKYDKFEADSQASTEYLHVMAKTLRYVAHSNGASLVYTREKDKVRTRRAAAGDGGKDRDVSRTGEHLMPPRTPSVCIPLPASSRPVPSARRDRGTLPSGAARRDEASHRAPRLRQGRARHVPDRVHARAGRACGQGLAAADRRAAWPRGSD